MSNNNINKKMSESDINKSLEKYNFMMGKSVWDLEKYIDNPFPNNIYVYGIVKDLSVSREDIADAFKSIDGEDDKVVYYSSITIKDSDSNEITFYVGNHSPEIIDTLEKIKLGQAVMVYGYLTSESSSEFKDDSYSNSLGLNLVAVGINASLGNKDAIEDYEYYEYGPAVDFPEDDYTFSDPVDYEPLSNIDTSDPEALRNYAINNPEIPDDYFE